MTPPFLTQTFNVWKIRYKDDPVALQLGEEMQGLLNEQLRRHPLINCTEEVRGLTSRIKQLERDLLSERDQLSLIKEQIETGQLTPKLLSGRWKAMFNELQQYRRNEFNRLTDLLSNYDKMPTGSNREEYVLTRLRRRHTRLNGQVHVTVPPAVPH